MVLGSPYTLNAQSVRTAAQLCSGISTVKPPISASQGGISQSGSLLPASVYVIVICAIDSDGKYSGPSLRITAATPLDYSSLGYSISTPSLFWSSNTAGYELFIGTAWASGSESFSEPDASALISYLGPKLIGAAMPTLPASISVSSIPTEILPSGVQGRPYSQFVLVPNASVIYQTPPFTWSLAGGNPPAGFSLDSTGLISGTPTTGGTFVFSGRITNTTGQSAVQQFSITVTQPLNVSVASVSFQVQNHQIVGTGSIVVTVSGNGQDQSITFTQTQPWIIATIQTSSPGAAVVCCPATIIASVDPSQFNSPGSYSGSLSINVSGLTAGTINYSVQVLTPAPPVTPTFDPTIKLTSVVNAASFGKDFAVASLVTLFGSSLASGTSSAQSLPLPVALGDVQLATCPSTDTQLSQCTDVQLVYASPTQINFLACHSGSSLPPPSGCTFSGGSQVLTVFRTGHLPAQPIPSPLLAAAPGTFQMGYDCAFNPLWNDPSPCGLAWTHYSSKQPLRGAVTDQMGNIVTSTNPALFGQQYTIWLTGLGVFTNGEPPEPIGIKIGGTPTNAFYDVSPSYVGPSSQFPGLYQINFPWPAGMMGGIATSDIQPCGDYKMEISFNISEGTEQDPTVFQVPLLVKNGDVPCLPP
jgi:uncharacterized protein (TIGR03437 family)